jgi:outer membrane protein assembly factor BamB
MPGFTLPLRLRWAVPLAPSLSYPIVARGMVFVVGLGRTSTLYALNATTGRIVWSRQTPKGFGNWIGAAYDNGMVFVVPASVPNDNAGAMFAYDASTGRQIWSTKLPGQYLFSSAPTARAGYVYTGGAGSGGTVYAVRESDGFVTWTNEVENGDSSAPAVTPQGVFVSYVCPQSYRFAPSSGALLWHFSGDCEGGGGESAAVYGGRVWVRDVQGGTTNGLILDEDTGKMLGAFGSTFSPAFWSGTGYFTEPYTLSAMTISSGTSRWIVSAKAGETFSCAPLVLNDTVFVPTSSGALVGYSGETGHIVFRVNLPTALTCNEYFSVPLGGMGAGDGLLVVPSGNLLTALE